MKILWIDDEIELLKAHILFLEKKGYQAIPINNATDALDLLKTESFSAVLIDENMPGIGGLDALKLIKEIHPYLPVVMVTKNEEESLMEEAIGSQISDYLIKPVNPNQILLSLKKILSSTQLITEKSIANYQQEFRNISINLMNACDDKDWVALYQNLVQWEMQLENIEDPHMLEILSNQKAEANQQFAKFVEKNYHNWLHEKDAPILSHSVFQKRISPQIKPQEKVLLLLIDNLRLDQWKAIQPLFTEFCNIKKEELYYSILPSSTQYARNAFFSGMMPLEIEKKFPQYWKNDNEEGNKNEFEEQLLQAQLKRLNQNQLKFKYYKILNTSFSKKVFDEFSQFKKNDLTVIVYNFIDILSHAKTDNKIVSEMIRDDKTYRSMTRNFFENSYLMKTLKFTAAEGMKIILTTDHGTIFVKNPIKVVGDRETSTNLRYKLGRHLQFDENDVFAIEQPEDYFLPKVNVSSKYIFAKENTFLAYPKNYNYYVNYYKNTYQHGGISMEEMIIPLVEMQGK